MDADPMSDDIIGEATITLRQLCIDSLDEWFEI